MNIHLHIDRLVLTGIDLPPGQRLLLHRTIETEIVRLLQAGGLAHKWQSGGAYHALRGGTIHLPDTQVTTLGPQIARAVYGGLSE